MTRRPNTRLESAFGTDDLSQPDGRRITVDAPTWGMNPRFWVTRFVRIGRS